MGHGDGLLQAMLGGGKDTRRVPRELCPRSLCSYWAVESSTSILTSLAHVLFATGKIRVEGIAGNYSSFTGNHS